MIGVIFILLLLMGCDIQTAEPEIHLIPQEFIGHIVLYFDVPDGSSPQREAEARLYKIPDSGQLSNSFAPNLGIRPHNSMHFYYVNMQGQRTSIPLRSAPKLTPETIVVSNTYIFNKELHYFVDRLDRIDTYKNPAIDDSERQWK